ncbi:Aconitate hydratase [Candidatus Bipolaricaulis anaerobius]|jgi:aconitate hydratase|uniref:Aconitate hydratase n=1 Tax=Candidatus Bipolaricaulis anaerobius TaxID=2026885 RepID=A0A2X3KZ14_9BACT|nr:Aconitate hydratase [Candidatus Bipolaricaulis anaerobius]
MRVAKTLTEKILAEHIVDGTLGKGREVGIRIDQCLTQDSTGTMAWLEFESLGLDKVQAELAVSYSDHTSLGFKGESTDDHLFLQSIASHYGAKFSKNGNGVCHQVHYERFGIPGKTLLGSDSHTPTAGGLGMLGIGAGGADVAVAMGGGPFYLTVPKVMRVVLTGKLPWGVTAKDVALEILRRISVKGGVGYFLEFTGPGVKILSVPERATITNMCTETGATSSIFPSDAVTKEFLELEGRGSDWRPLVPDPDAIYDATVEIDLSALVPLVAMPGSPDNVVPVTEVAGTRIDQVYIGSCTNGSYRDIRVVAELLRGRRVAKEIDVIVSPGSRQAWEMLIADGSFLALTQAGVRMIEPGCNACIGIGFVPGTNSLSLRTVNRNWKGRGGNELAKLALASPEVAAASALKGVIADPRELPPVAVRVTDLIVDDTLIIEPEGGAVPVRRAPNIVKMAPPRPLPAVLKGEVLIVVGDGVSTDAILPAGPLTQHLRSNLPEIAKFTFHYEDKTFAARAVEKGGGFIVAGENYGQGSSREHAALAPWQLGITAVIAKSYARIHKANLVNVGILPLVGDTTGIDQGDMLEIDISDLTRPLVVRNLTKGTEVPVRAELSERERRMVKAGGLLAMALAGRR